jgi:hypothetical protein
MTAPTVVAGIMIAFIMFIVFFIVRTVRIATFRRVRMMTGTSVFNNK